MTANAAKEIDMRRIIRCFVAWIVVLTSKHACKTYGEAAELSKGPCGRCVGREVRGAKVDA